MNQIDRAAAQAMGYPTVTSAEFELAEFIRFAVGDLDHLHRTTSPPGTPMTPAAQAAHVGAGEGSTQP